MYRFFVPAENISGHSARITGDDVNHIKNVLRMGAGEKVVISCGQGEDYYCIIEDIREKEVALSVEEVRADAHELPVSLTLFQALPKGDKMELVIQKAVELGVSEIVPVRTRRCVVKLDEKKAEKKTARWNAVARAAAKQSGRGIVPAVREVADFSEALAVAGEMETVLIPYELCDDMAGTVAVMRRASEGKSIGVFIGPEGGFERGEVEQAVAQGALPVSLGKRILRTETAGIAALSVLMFLIEGSKS